MSYQPPNDWRKDPGLISTVIYKKKFAIFPKKCEDGSVLWFKPYYTKYLYWGWKHTDMFDPKDPGLHEDKLESITEAEYIVRRLSEDI